MKYRVKKLLSIIFYIIMIFVCLFLLKTNKDFDYNENINNKETYDKYSLNKYVTFDLKDAKLNRLATKKGNKEYYFYTLTIEDEHILFYLNKNTALTKNVSVIKYNDDKLSTEIKNSLENDNDNSVKYNKGYYSNVNYENNYKLLVIKKYAAYVIIGLLSILSIIDLLLLIFKKHNN